MFYVIITIIIVACLICIVLMETSSNTEKQNNCVKHASKLCPSRLHVTNSGTFYRTDNYKCCKYIDQVKAINEFACLAEPGKSYNGMIITQEFKDNALRQQKHIQSLNSDGPSD